jgi:hypothetical protein
MSMLSLLHTPILRKHPQMQLTHSRAFLVRMKKREHTHIQQKFIPGFSVILLVDPH